MEDICEQRSVDKLVVLCAKLISSRPNALLLYKQHLNNLFQLKFPDAVLDSLLSSLPINVLLELEENHSDLSIAISNVWLKIFRGCQLKCSSFREKTSDILPNFKGLADDMNKSLLKRCKRIFMDLYFKEILNDCVVRCEQPEQLKILCSDSEGTLFDALGQNKHDNTETETLCLFLRHIETLRIEFKHIDCLQDVFDGENYFKNITKLDLIWRKSSDEVVYKWKSLLELVFQCTEVNDFFVKISAPCSKFKDLLQFCVKLKASNVSLTLWDEQDQCADNIVSLDSLLCYKEVLCNIKDLTIEWSPCEFELDHFYQELLPSCNLLEHLSAQCNNSSRVTIALLKGLEILCESGNSKLEFLRIVCGVFGVAELLSLGSSLKSVNSSNKDITFDRCVFEDAGTARLDEETHSANYAISTLSIIECASSYSMNQLFSRLLRCYNPEILIVFSMKSTSLSTHREGFPIHHELFEYENARLKHISFGFEQSASYFIEFVNCMLLFLREKADSVDLLVAYVHDEHRRLEAYLNKAKIFKSVTFKKSDI